MAGEYQTESKTKIVTKNKAELLALVIHFHMVVVCSFTELFTGNDRLIHVRDPRLYRCEHTDRDVNGPITHRFPIYIIYIRLSKSD